MTTLARTRTGAVLALAAPALLLVPLSASAPPAGAVAAPPPGELASLPADDDVPVEDALDRRAAAANGDAKVLIEVSREAEAAGDLDRALWFAKVAVDVAGEGREGKAARARWIEARDAAAAPGDDPVDMIRAFAKEVYGIAKACESRKLYANAADILNQCKGTAYDGEARAKLEKLFSKKQAVELLLESGVPVEVETRQRLSKKEIEKIDAETLEWENHLVIESRGGNYEIHTNMGYEMAWSIADAMDQINVFYKTVFGLQRKNVGKCILYVYKNREEFDQHAQPGSPGVQGYFMPGSNTVHTFDHGTTSLGREYLWKTLFHEASHQFSHRVWKLLIPGWLNEGTASYFEGAVLQAGGFIATNRIPDSRLRNLVAMIGRGSKEGESSTGRGRPGSPSLKDVVSYFSPGSYSGSYYPFGWGLVYFCRNFENDASERPYLEAYEDFKKSYEGGSGERNAFKRFEQIYIEEERHPGIDSFAAFEQLWQSWIRDLYEIQYGGPEQADVLVARGKKQLADGFPGNAVESLRWATEKNPLHATAWYELGQAALATKEKKYEDAALYAFRRLVALAQRQVDLSKPLAHYGGTAEEARVAALAGIKAVNSGIVRTFEDKLGGIVGATSAAATTYVEAGYPRTALALLRDADALLDGDGRLRTRIHELMEKNGVDGRLRRLLPVDEDLTAWTSEEDGWKGRADGAIEFTGGRGVSTLRLLESPPKIFRFEATVETDEMVGLLFDGQTLDESYFMTKPGGLCAVMKYDSDVERMMERGSPFETLESFKGKAPSKKADSFRFAIDVEHSQLRVFIDDELVGTLDLPAEEFTGKVGLAVQGKRAVFRDVRLAY